MRSNDDIVRFERYFSNLTEEPICLTRRHADFVRNVWSEINSLIRDIDLPIACQFENEFKFVWNKEYYYVELIMYDNCKIEWFIIDRKDYDCFLSENSSLNAFCLSFINKIKEKECLG
jgi:hypothetical protein